MKPPGDSRVGAFLRRHRRTEEEIAEGVAASFVWTFLRRAGVFGAGVAAAAVLNVPSLVDLSNNNGAGAAVAIAAPGVVAVEAKATEGLSFRDRDYAIFRASAYKHHRAFGGYMFLHPNESGAAQADYFLAFARPRPGDIQPVVDSETGSPASAARATYAALHELERHGYHPILYASSSYVAGLVAADPRIKRFRVWYAEYGPRLHIVAGTVAVAWQFTDRAHVNGISVDGSHLLVRSVAQLEIPKPRTHPSPAPKVKHPAKPAKASASVLRSRTGYWSWLAWRLGAGAWKGYGKANVHVRPHVRAHVPRSWWTLAAAHVAAGAR